MVKKLIFPLVGIVLLAFLFSFTMSTPLMAQEQEEAEDVMDMDLEDLLNVEITTAGKQAEKISEIPASVVLITRAEIEKYGYRNLQEILESVPGYYVIDQYAVSRKTMGVRGFWSPYTRGVIVMINGVDQRQDIYAHYPLNKMPVPVESIDRVEVVRGPMSVIYGSGAFFGAINIITNEKSEEKNNMVAVSYASDNSSSVFVRGAGGNEDSNFSVNVMLDDNTGVDEKWSEMSSMYEGSSATSEGYLYNKNYYFNLSSSYKDFYADFIAVRNDEPIHFLYIGTQDKKAAISDFLNLKVGYKHKFTDKVSIDLKVGYYMTKINGGFFWDIIPPVLPYMHYSDHRFGSQSIDFEGNLYLNPSEKFNVTFGVYYRKLLQRFESIDHAWLDYHNTIIEQPNDNKLESYAGYVQANFKPSKKLKLVAGLRLEKAGDGLNHWAFGYGLPAVYNAADLPLEATDVQVIPRAALIYSFNEKNIIKILYGKAVRMPSYFENNDLYLYPEMEPLSPEIINTLELNYIAALSSKITINLSVYRNMLENLIYRKEWLDAAGNYFALTTNEGKMNTTGVEVAIKTRPTDKIDLDLSFSYQDTEDELAKDRDVMASPKVLAYGKVAYSITKDITIAFSANYVGKMVAQYDVQTSSRTGDDIPAYFNLGANLRFNDLFKKGWFLNFRVSNLLDETIRYPTYSHSAWANKGTLGMGRILYVTLGKKF